jgi:Ca-activated chloride channel family protein
MGYVVVQRRRPRYAVRFTNLDLLDVVAPRRPGWRRHVPAVALVGALACMVVGLARPVRSQWVSRQEATLVLAVDVSPSMMATDVLPSRFAAMRQAVDRFVGLLPRGFRLGLVSFAGTAQVVVAPTTDHDLVRQAVEKLQFRSETGLGEAIFASLDALALGSSGDDLSAAGVVLMSDGSQTMGRSWDEAAHRAHDGGVPVSTIAFGTAKGTVTLGGETIPVPPDPGVLRTIAQDTGGRAFQAATAQELTGIYRAIGRSAARVREPREVGEWFVAAALALVLVAATLSLAWFARIP